MSGLTEWAERRTARIGGVGVYATPADLVAHCRTRSERLMRALLTCAAAVLIAPLAFLVPPHMEPPVLVLIVGAYFTRRAWVGEWVVERLSGECPRCGAALTLRRGTVLYLPHSLSCRACRSELWLELGEAPAVADAVRRAAIERAAELRDGPPGGRPPQTWSPAASDWRDRRRD